MMVIVIVNVYGNSKLLIIGLNSGSACVEKGFWETLGKKTMIPCSYIISVVFIFNITVFSRGSEIIQILRIIYCFPPQLNPDSQ